MRYEQSPSHLQEFQSIRENFIDSFRNTCPQEMFFQCLCCHRNSNLMQYICFVFGNEYLRAIFLAWKTCMSFCYWRRHIIDHTINYRIEPWPTSFWVEFSWNNAIFKRNRSSREIIFNGKQNKSQTACWQNKLYSHWFCWSPTTCTSKHYEPPTFLHMISTLHLLILNSSNVSP